MWEGRGGDKVLLKFFCLMTFIAFGVVSGQDRFEETVNVNTAFAWDVFEVLRKEPGNLLFSPYTIGSGLTLLYEGAEGVTANEIRSVLGIKLSPSEQTEKFSQLTRHLTSYRRDLNPDFKLVLIDSLWLQTGFALLPSFSQDLPIELQDRIRRLDFARQTEAARSEINRRVLERTYGRIPDIINQDILSPNSKMVLVTGAYLKARWQQPFQKQFTRNGSFFPTADNTVSIPMMEVTGNFSLLKDEDVWLLELPYMPVRSSPLQFSMVIILPTKQESWQAFENGLSQEKWEDWLSRLLPAQPVTAVVPKFSLANSMELKRAMERLGVASAFGEGADFSRMTTAKGILLSQVVHKAFFSIDEMGADVSANGMVKPQDVSSKAFVFRVERPFLFVVMEKSTGTILFIGRFLAP
jgi:serpin B